MKISLLRRIWQRIITDTAAPPRQRLTGFEPLEPRMVLSGFIAHYAPDYFSPPPGDYIEVERTGAEFARPIVAYGGYSNYNSFDRDMAAEPLMAVLSHPALGGRGIDGGTPYGSFFESLGPFLSPLSNAVTKSELNYDVDGDSSLEKVKIVNVPITPETSISYISISPLAVDSILGDMRAMTSNFSFAAGSALTTMSPMSSSFRSLTDRDYNPVSSGGAVERHSELHDYAALAHGSNSDATISLAARQATSATIDRGVLNSAANAALANQMAGVNSSAVQSANGSAASGQANAAANGASDHQQNGLLELTDAERLKLKRKLVDGVTETEEATDSTADRVEQYEGSDIQVAYDPTRPFDVTAAPEGQIRQGAADMADDGLIEVLATDITVTLTRGDVTGDATANRQIVMEPAVATYQAFEIVVDGDSQAATDAVVDAARLAGTVAMSAQPVVQAE